MGGQRRSGRIAKEIGILLLGTDNAGRVFSEQTQTVVLSRHGAGILSQHRLAPDELLTIRFLGGAAEVAVRLVGEIGHDVRGYTYGVAFVDPDLDFWELKFPAAPQWHGSTGCALECSLCQNREIVDQTEVEADVFALAGYILRLCSKCGTSTEWRRATTGEARSPLAPKISIPVATLDHSTTSRESADPETVDTSSASTTYSGSAQRRVPIRAARTVPIAIASSHATSEEKLPPAATTAVARAANRRRDVRTRVSFTACVRQEHSNEEIVECDNISKGGLSFRSRRSYLLDCIIDVAVPFSTGAPAIFVLAQVRHIVPLAGGTLFRYGAVYLSKDDTSRS